MKLGEKDRRSNGGKPALREANLLYNKEIVTKNSRRIFLIVEVDGQKQQKDFPGINGRR